MRNAGFPWRPYVLRSYFDSQLMLAESKGKILRDYRAFFMGHKGDIEHTYTLNKHNLPPNILEDMREAYSRSQEFLQTGKPEGKSEEETKVAMLKQFLIVVGFTNEELDKIDLLNMDGEEINKMARERWLQKIAKTQGDRAQRLATLDEMEALVKAGWVYVATLPNDKVVMNPPAGSTEGPSPGRS